MSQRRIVIYDWRALAKAFKVVSLSSSLFLVTLFPLVFQDFRVNKCSLITLKTVGTSSQNSLSELRSDPSTLHWNTWICEEDSMWRSQDQSRGRKKLQTSVPGSTSDVRTFSKPTPRSWISKWALWEDSIPTGQSGEVSHHQCCRKCCIIAVLPDAWTDLFSFVDFFQILVSELVFVAGECIVLIYRGTRASFRYLTLVIQGSAPNFLTITPMSSRPDGGCHGSRIIIIDWICFVLAFKVCVCHLVFFYLIVFS